MTDTAVIGAGALAFGAMTWLLALSYFLGKHASRVDTLEALHKQRDEQVQRIFEKIDVLTALVPHTCHQAERLARLEERTGRGEDRQQLRDAREEAKEHNP